jgi:hypothetical protein
MAHTADQKSNNSNQVYGIIGTIAFHALLLLLLSLALLRTPIPPFAGGGGGYGLGIEVNLGNSDDGRGDIQDEQIAMPQFTAPPKTQTPTAFMGDEEVKSKAKTADEDILANEKGEETNLKSTPGVVAKKVKKEPEPIVNQQALYKGKSQKPGNNQGTTDKPGDQGNPNGTAQSNIYKGNGSGSGSGSGTGKGSGSGSGSGTGSGSGNGSGTGSGTGGGVNYSLEGRNPKSLLKPSYNSEDQGKVVVTIWVNKEGKVIKALAGGKGTSTSDQKLWKMAEEAAKRSTFTAKPDAAEEQKGTITYKFVKSK